MHTSIRADRLRRIPLRHLHPHQGRARGQVLAVAALAIVAMVSMVALVLEGGNAYAQQRMTQNASDAVANAGAVVLAQKLSGAARTDADVETAVDRIATSNDLSAITAYYTDVAGRFLDAGGSVTDQAGAAVVGDGVLPPGAQGIYAGGTRSFGTFFGRVLGINSLDASAVATAVTGRLEGGQFLPVVFPINIVDCEVNGDLGSGEANWQLSQPANPPSDPPNGPEYIVPLCKTGSGSFMVLDLDGEKNNCDDEVINPPAIRIELPSDLASDNGNNCAKKMVDAVNARRTKVFLVPICDVDCITSGGSKATYHIVKVAAFWVDYMSDSNNPNNSLCEAGTSPYTGRTVTPIRGNGSSSCIAGFFVRYIESGPVGAGPIGNTDAIGVQLIR